ncbi:MAG: hypothetical protein IT363_11225 [Methanoregulaceae archaeon]|nr:hypothetical protein [Methanoregulaceae archaeon]
MPKRRQPVDCPVEFGSALEIPVFVLENTMPSAPTRRGYHLPCQRLQNKNSSISGPRERWTRLAPQKSRVNRLAEQPIRLGSIVTSTLFCGK